MAASVLRIEGTEGALGRSTEEYPPWDVDAGRDRFGRKHAGRRAVRSAVQCWRKDRSRRTRGDKNLRLSNLQSECQKHGENDRSEHVAPSTYSTNHLIR